MSRVSRWILMCAVLLGGCSLGTGVGNHRQIGAIGYPDNLLISVPDSVRVGRVFTVSVRTFGADGCWKADGTAVAVDGLTATVTPYDADRTSPGVACTMMVIQITHQADLQFGRAGQATIAFHGRDGTATRQVTVY